MSSPPLLGGGRPTAVSATGFFPRAITAPGQMEENANTPHFQLLHIEAYRDATAVASRTSRCVQYPLFTISVRLTETIKCDRNLPVCNHCAEENETDCNYTPKKRHKVPSDHITTRDRPVAPYAAKTAAFLVSDMPSGSGPHGENTGHGTGRNHVFESEMRTEPQIRQYIPPHSPALYDGEENPELHTNDYAYQQASNDGKFTWVRSRHMTNLHVNQSVLTSAYGLGYDCHNSTYRPLDPYGVLSFTRHSFASAELSQRNRDAHTARIR